MVVIAYQKIIKILKHQLIFVFDIQLFFACFSKGSPNEDEVNLFCSIICFWLEGNISLPVSYPFLSIFSDNKADIFAASVLI